MTAWDVWIHPMPLPRGLTQTCIGKIRILANLCADARDNNLLKTNQLR